MVSMVHSRFLLLCGLVPVLLVSSCVDGSSPVAESPTGTVGVGLQTVFPAGTTADQTAAVLQIRITIKRASDDVILTICLESVDPVPARAGRQLRDGEHHRAYLY